MERVTYIVIWNWREDVKTSMNKRDEVVATNALRTIQNLRRRLAAEYAFAPRDFVPLEVVRALSHTAVRSCTEHERPLAEANQSRLQLALSADLLDAPDHSAGVS